MRLIIKGADFSTVSIGKVVKDLSFEYHHEDCVEWLTNPPTVSPIVFPVSAGTEESNNSSTVYYAASSSDSSYRYTDNQHRYTSDFIEVTPGMKIKGLYTTGTATVPTIVCFDSSMNNPLTPISIYAYWGNTSDDGWAFTIPNNVKYIKIQINTLFSGGKILGEMPI